MAITIEPFGHLTIFWLPDKNLIGILSNFLKVAKCWRARISVGATKSEVDLFVWASKQAKIAITVLPEPTSPWSKRLLGVVESKSCLISPQALIWAGVNLNGRVVINWSISIESVNIWWGVLLAQDCLLINDWHWSDNISSRPRRVVASSNFFKLVGWWISWRAVFRSIKLAWGGKGSLTSWSKDWSWVEKKVRNQPLDNPEVCGYTAMILPVFAWPLMAPIMVFLFW